MATRPLRDGVISDYTVTEKMLKYFINKICGKFIFAPRIMICIPSQVTEVEKKAVIKTETVKKVSTELMQTSMKMNGVEEGMQQYNEVVNLLLDYYEGTLF